MAGCIPILILGGGLCGGAERKLHKGIAERVCPKHNKDNMNRPMYLTPLLSQTLGAWTKLELP